jgi:hypothetical protein
VAPPLTEREQHLAISLYCLLADGQPVEATTLAGRADMDRDEAERALLQWAASSPTRKTGLSGSSACRSDPCHTA